MSWSAVSKILLSASALAVAGAPPRAVAQALPPYSDAAVESLRILVTAEVEQIRGHVFESPVPIRVVDVEHLRTYLLERIDTHLPPDLVRNQAEAYADLGLLPEGLDLLEVMIGLLQEQAAAFYDPEDGVVFLLAHFPWESAPVFLAHELTHALDDQLFDLERTLEAVMLDTDRGVAHAGAREGSGSAVMTVFMTRWSMAGKLDLAAFRAIMDAAAQSQASLGKVPPVVARALVAPYVLGQDFVLRGEPVRMWGPHFTADLDSALTRLPESTEQLLHPEKYWSSEAPDPPSSVELPALAQIAGEGWNRAAEGTLGELDLACLSGDCSVPSNATTTAWTNAGAEGWAGDRWQLLRNGDATITVLAIAWDAPGDAEEFERSARLPAGALMRSEERRTVVVAGAAGDRASALLEAALGFTVD